MFAQLPERHAQFSQSLAASVLLHALPFLLAILPLQSLLSGAGDGPAFAQPTPDKPKTSSPNAAAPPPDSPVHFGIILWPEAEPTKVLRIPPPRDPNRFSRRLAQAPQLDLPFTGVYLIYQDPNNSPPPKSPVLRGAPADFKFRSADMSPLHLDARQALPGPIELQTLSALEVSFINVDIFRNAVELEIIAVDTTTRPRRLHSLGSLPLPGGTPLKAKPDPTEHHLRFPIPARAQGPTDELLLRFHLLPFRAATAPRIRLNAFRFVPRH